MKRNEGMWNGFFRTEMKRWEEGFLRTGRKS
jgi:hypothetical protein